MQPKQVQAIGQCAAALLWHAGVSCERLTAQHVRAFLAELARRGRSRKTLLNVRSAISIFCRFLMAHGLLSGNPAAEVRLAKPEQQPPRYLEPEEITAVLHQAQANGIWPEICLALASGLRLAELQRLLWTDVDLHRRILFVRKTKSHRPRIVPLNDAALEAFRRQREIGGSYQYVFPARRTYRGGWQWVDRPRAQSSWRRMIHPIQDCVPKFRQTIGTGRGWHLLRHTFASHAAQAGVSLYKLAQWLGHADVRTTTIYAHLQQGYDPDIERIDI
jgi:integrase/recombinase XerC